MITMVSMTDDGRVERVLAGESRAALLTALVSAGRPLSLAEAAQQVGLRPSTTRFHLDLLVSAGLVDRTAERRATVGRPRIHYAARPASGGTAPGDYEGLVNALADQLSATPDPVGAAREAGRRWTQALGVRRNAVAATRGAAVEAVAGLLDRLGFAPDRPAGPDRINLRRCPFEVVARQQRGVVCGVHEGMLVETFQRLGRAGEVARLEAFAVDEPLLCVVHLRTLADPAPDSRVVVGEGENGITEPSARRRPDRASRGLADA